MAACDSRPQREASKSDVKTLTQLCDHFPTDKCPFHHNYVEIYDMLFSQLRNQPIRILEIGVLKGDSLRLWEAYFPTARIFGIDIADLAHHNTSRIKTLIADQSDRRALARIIRVTGGEFDIILDDGGHRMEQQQISFGVLFPTLKSGGLYIIEDIHTSFPDRYPGFGVESDGRNSTYALIDGYARTLKIQSKYLTSAENDYLSRNISYCSYYLRSNKFHSDFFACRKK
jgi:demethylmacrocin O-methyltransferase